MGDTEACPDPTVIIDIPVDLEPNLKETCWIQRVPRNLRQVNSAAYTPKLVSIGPFHHGKQELKAMEHHKAKYYDKFWERDFCKHIGKKDIIRYFTGDHFLPCIRNSYAGTFDQPLNDDAHRFSKVILQDSCFIFELFLRNYQYELYLEDCRLHDKPQEQITDYILRTPCLKKAIELDLIMVENQIPFFVFTKLFNFILDSQPGEKQENLIIPDYLSKDQDKDHREDFITDITCTFFADNYRNGKVVEEEKNDGKGLFKCFTSLLCCTNEPRQESVKIKEFKHFTDLVRQYFLRPDSDVVYSKNITTRCYYSAKELDRAGVHFSPCKNKFADDIQSEKGKFISWNSLTLKIPQFKVEDNTECLMRNVMALEQCLYPDEAHICNYIFLLDQLIDTVEDVDFMVKKRVVDNWQGSNKAVANLINKLCDGIVITNFCYSQICEQLNKHHENPWNVAKATLKRVYFKDIWTGSSTVVAVVFLIFSIVSVTATIRNNFF